MVDLRVSKTHRKLLKTAAETETKGAASVVTDEPSSDEFLHMVAVAAYYLAERRNFEPGHESEDWLAAEAQIRLELGA